MKCGDYFGVNQHQTFSPNRYFDFNIVYATGNKNPQGRYCRESVIPNIGIILRERRITTYLNNCNPVTPVCNM
jgi:hypothetical protein